MAIEILPFYHKVCHFHQFTVSRLQLLFHFSFKMKKKTMKASFAFGVIISIFFKVSTA